jgi:hypothetical protein
MCILLPCLALLFRLVLGGSFDPRAARPAVRGAIHPLSGRARLVLPGALAALGVSLALFGGQYGEYVGFVALFAFIASGVLALLQPALAREAER